MIQVARTKYKGRKPESKLYTRYRIKENSFKRLMIIITIVIMICADFNVHKTKATIVS